MFLEDAVTNITAYPAAARNFAAQFPHGNPHPDQDR
jgi:hypothetical protein